MTREMAQWLKYLPCKQEDRRSSGLRIYMITRWAFADHLWAKHLKGSDREKQVT